MPQQVQSIYTGWTELASTTYRKMIGTNPADNVSRHNALMRKMYTGNRMRREDGGLSIVAPLEYASNSTYQRYSGFDPLNINAVDVITTAEYPWRQVAVNVAASGLEIRSNMGESRIINFTKSKVRNAINSFKNGLSADLYSDGTAANQINGLQAVISDTGLGTIGQIPATTFPFWQNVVQQASAPIQGGGAVTISPSTIESLMLPLYIRLTRGEDQPDIIVMADDLFSVFEQSQTSLKRYTDETSATAGMISLKYKRADVFFDSSGGIPASRAYFINTTYLELVTHSAANMTVMDELKSVNQDAIVIPVLWQGNLACSNRALQGVLRP